LGTEDNDIALLGIKCLYELQSIDIMESVCSKFLAKGDGKLCLERLNMTAVHFTALLTFLSNSKNLKQLALFHCTIQYNWGYNFESLLVTLCNTITSLRWTEGGLTDVAAEYLNRVLASKNCKITELDLGANEITDQGVRYFSEALKSENCKLTALNLSANEITDQGLRYLSEALKSENCKLTALNLSANEITDQGVRYLSEALKSENCKLTALNVRRNKITDQGFTYLSQAAKGENCEFILK
jgi:Ran GTPase-activating protein (RanGAP) involved in mRNA processing and transport